MNRNELIAIFIIYLLVPFTAYGQGHVSIEIPVIYSDVTVNDNWFPPTAVNGFDQNFDGTALGYGVSLYYSFHPKLLVKDEHFLIDIGIGYFLQRFDVTRPFDYKSPLKIIFYTDHYSYHCIRGTLGLSYNYPIALKYSLSGRLSYCHLKTFQQEYKPKWEIDPPSPQINKNTRELGDMVIPGVGITRTLSERLAVSLNIIVPIRTRWRNDKIFKDDPATFLRPKVSVR